MRRVLWVVRLSLALAGLSLPLAAFGADPPERVGRVSYVDGDLSVGGLEGGPPVTAPVNYPVAAGMRFTTAAGSRAELQLGMITARIGGKTNLTFVALDDDAVGLRLDGGSLDLRVRVLFDNERVTVGTGDGQVVIEQPGAYRIDAGQVNPPDGGKPTGPAITHLVVFEGTARVHSPHGADDVFGGESIDVDGPRGTVKYGLIDHTWLSEWALDRERITSPTIADRYVSPDMTGAGALDTAGVWEETNDYGTVWYPTDVPMGWEPYQSGTWAWVAPWGWTWIDNRPWGFAPFHYGRWVKVHNRWGWWPGDRHRRHTYAPALVSFGAGYTYSHLHRPHRWTALGPGQKYHPFYRHRDGHAHHINQGRPDHRRFRGNWTQVRGDGVRGDGVRGGGGSRRDWDRNGDGRHDWGRNGDGNRDRAGRTDGVNPETNPAVPTGVTPGGRHPNDINSRGGHIRNRDGNIVIRDNDFRRPSRTDGVPLTPATPVTPTTQTASPPPTGTSAPPEERVVQTPYGGSFRMRGNNLVVGDREYPVQTGAGVTGSGVAQVSPTSPITVNPAGRAPIPTTPMVTNPAGATPMPVTPMATNPAGSFAGRHMMPNTVQQAPSRMTQPQMFQPPTSAPFAAPVQPAMPTQRHPAFYGNAQRGTPMATQPAPAAQAPTPPPAMPSGGPRGLPPGINIPGLPR